MNSYPNYPEPDYQSQLNNYGFSYSNYDSAYPGYNTIISNISSSNSSPASIGSSAYSQAHFNQTSQPYYLNQNYSQLSSPSQYSYGYGPSSSSYGSSSYSNSSINSLSQSLTSTPSLTQSVNSTPITSHYTPVSYTTTYTSTPVLPLNDLLTKKSEKFKTPMKPKTKATSKSRPKVLKLDLSVTNIGFGTLEQIVLPSDISYGPNVSTKSFQCPECTSSFSSAAKLYMHHHKQHNNRSSTECPICCKIFNSPANALVHLKAHTQEKEHKCLNCNMAFCDSSTLKKHIRTHTGEKPYECHLCPKKFAQSGNLKRHLAVHEKYDGPQPEIHFELNNNYVTPNQSTDTATSNQMLNEYDYTRSVYALN